MTEAHRFASDGDTKPRCLECGKHPLEHPITMERKSAYGVERLYPQGEAAQLLQRLTGKKTLDAADVVTLRKLGVTVEVV